VEIGAFLLFIVLLVVVVVGGSVLMVAARLRRAKLDPEEDRLASGSTDEPQRRPRHRRVTNEHRSRFLTHR
jgi:hypothetical protein